MISSGKKKKVGERVRVIMHLVKCVQVYEKETSSENSFASLKTGSEFTDASESWYLHGG